VLFVEVYKFESQILIVGSNLVCDFSWQIIDVRKPLGVLSFFFVYNHILVVAVDFNCNVRVQAEINGCAKDFNH